MLKSTQVQKNKNIFQNIFTIYSLILILVVNCSADLNNNIENKTEIKYGYPNQSIFIATVNGKEQPITPMLSVAKELFERANLSWNSTAYPAKRLFRNLKNGETDFSILVRASSLLESCIFSKKPVYSTDLNIYYIGDKPPVITKEDLIGKSIVTIRGYSYGKLRKFIEDPKNNITNEVTNTHNSAFRMLELGRVDYLLDYESAAKDIISKNSISKIQSNTINQLNVFLVLSKYYPNADELMKRLESIVESININEIISKTSNN
ncbi:ABC transporter substrate-binding protein [Arcobacter sp. LA11]|uniref:substrate-binding periplasmic protein n=1 Tax=Arcobacter sp. LA11 TaxID=1898176 RepID=UPI000932F73A|nr:transporter substrate-binding domain-containing protein [Arcobacter sp. LA11]